MAEIKIEKKKAVWPWIIAILLIAAVIYFIYFRENTTANQTDTIENTNGAANTIPNNKTITANGINVTAYESIIA